MRTKIVAIAGGVALIGVVGVGISLGMTRHRRAAEGSLAVRKGSDTALERAGQAEGPVHTEPDRHKADEAAVVREEEDATAQKSEAPAVPEPKTVEQSAAPAAISPAPREGELHGDEVSYFPHLAFSRNRFIHKSRAEGPSQQLRAMSELRLCTGEWTGCTIYRVLVYCHQAEGEKPICVRLARVPTGECESSVVVLKHGGTEETGFKPGAVERRETERLTAREWADLEAALREEKLMDLPGWHDADRLRGVTCIIEVVNDDRYHAVRRWGGRVENRRFNRAARAILKAAGLDKKRLCVPDHLDIKDNTVVMVRTLDAWGVFRLYDQDLLEEAKVDGIYRRKGSSGGPYPGVKEWLRLGSFRLRWSAVRKGLGRIHYDGVTGICVTNLDRLEGIEGSDLRMEYWVSPFDRLDLGEEYKAQRAAVEALGDIGPEDLPALALLLKDGSGPVRRYAVYALGEIGLDALPVLLDALTHRRDDRVHEQASTVLHQLGPDVMLALINALKSEDRPVVFRSGVADALGKFGPAAADAVPALIEALGHTTFDLRINALRALEKIGPNDKEAIPALVRVLATAKSQGSRCGAARTLGKMGPAGREAVPSLVRALEDKDRGVRCYVAEALGGIGPPAREAVPTLLRSLKEDKFEGARANAALALAKISPEAKGVLVALKEALERDRADWVRTSIAEALGYMDPAANEVVPVLVGLLKDNNVSMRWEAAKALGRFGPAAKSAVPGLQGLWSDPNSIVRAAVAESLGKIGPAAKDAVAALRALLADPERCVRRAAAEAIPRIDPKAELKPPPSPPPGEVF